jgi:hypothetical protein
MDLVFRWRHFAPEGILPCVRGYCKYGIRYRGLEKMMAERGIAVDLTTLYHWVQPMHLSGRSTRSGTRAVCALAGVWMKPPLKFAVSRSAYSASSIRRAAPSIEAELGAQLSATPRVWSKALSVA